MNSQNPLVVVAWILAVFVGLPGLIAAVRLIFFVAEASKDLKTVVKYVHDRRTSDSVMEITLTLVENDITTIQDHLDLPTHVWPDRRVGPSDRRQA
jgi:hypothetical protein